MMTKILSLLLLLLPKSTSGWTAVSSQLSYTSSLLSSSSSPSTTPPTPPPTTTALPMGVFDSISNFLNNREGDFIKLDKSSENEFGPGPAILLYQIPNGIDDVELRDMLSDGAPQATSKGISLKRINYNGGDYSDNDLLSLSLREALETVVETAITITKQQSNNDITLSTDAGILASTPVLLFSGFLDREMLDSYQIIGKEIWEETGGQASAACAKAVPAAMGKPLQQVLEEISGDHQEAIKE